MEIKKQSLRVKSPPRHSHYQPVAKHLAAQRSISRWQGIALSARYLNLRSKFCQKPHVQSTVQVTVWTELCLESANISLVWSFGQHVWFWIPQELWKEKKNELMIFISHLAFSSYFSYFWDLEPQRIVLIIDRPFFWRLKFNLFFTKVKTA